MFPAGQDYQGHVTGNEEFFLGLNTKQYEYAILRLAPGSN